MDWNIQYLFKNPLALAHPREVDAVGTTRATSGSTGGASTSENVDEDVRGGLEHASTGSGSSNS